MLKRSDYVTLVNQCQLSAAENPLHNTEEYGDVCPVTQSEIRRLSIGELKFHLRTLRRFYPVLVEDVVGDYLKVNASKLGLTGFSSQQNHYRLEALLEIEPGTLQTVSRCLLRTWEAGNVSYKDSNCWEVKRLSDLLK